MNHNHNQTPNQEKRLPGWIRGRDASIAAQRARNGGRLETDIKAYNEQLRRQKEHLLAFSRARLRADRVREELELQNELKEVWE